MISKLALISLLCLGISLGVSAIQLFRKDPWKVIEAYAEKNENRAKLDGSSLVDYYKSEFKNRQPGDENLQEIGATLKRFVRFLSASKPEDCNEANSDEVERVDNLYKSGVIKSEVLYSVYKNALLNYVQLCELKVAADYKVARDRLTPKQDDMVKDLAKRLMVINAQSVGKSISTLKLSDAMMSQYEDIDRAMLKGVVKEDMVDACGEYIDFIGELFQPLIDLSKHMGRNKFEVYESEGARFGWWQWELCKTYMDGKVCIHEDTNMYLFTTL